MVNIRIIPYQFLSAIKATFPSDPEYQTKMFFLINPVHLSLIGIFERLQKAVMDLLFLGECILVEADHSGSFSCASETIWNDSSDAFRWELSLQGTHENG